jgi:hypothetical protein
MQAKRLRNFCVTLGAIGLAASAASLAAPPWFTWTTVVNNTDLMPTEGCEKDLDKCKPFNSYNQPSVNERGRVVIRARSRGGQGDTGGHGGGEHETAAVLASDEGGGGSGGSGGSGSGTEHGNQPVHGIYTRDMSDPENPGPIVRILDRKTAVPQPNNIRRPPENSPNTGPLTTFVETPSFPRIDMLSDTVATRANHQPVWKVLENGEIVEQLGTTGIYTNPFGDLITGASKLGAAPGLEFFAVPGTDPPVMFDVFPGAPAVTGGDTIVFKGNFTFDGAGRTGVFYRTLTEEPIELDDTELAPAGGMSDVVLIANNVETVIPDTDPPAIFGSTSPPSAANGQVVFAGFDNEENPTVGGIYLAPLEEYDPKIDQPDLTPLVSIGDQVPGERKGAVFNRLGEGVAFDGRYVAFWGAWGAMRTIRLHCPTEGNKDRVAFCLTQCPEPQGCSAKAPVRQGIFLHDTQMGETFAVAKAPTPYGDFLFWNFSGMVPGVGGGEDGSEEDGEPARWRSSAFVAVSGQATAFKAVASRGQQGGCGSCHSGGVGSAPPTPSHGQPIGIYLNRQPGQDIITVLDTGTDGQLLDPEAPAGSIVSELGLEREGLRGNWIAVSAKIGVAGGSEEDGMAGVYITTLPPR